MRHGSPSESPERSPPGQPPLNLAPGSKLGPYLIVGLAGSGGMGEVYRARDGRLGRDVALKVLPAEAARDPTRLHRFEQEARAASALNHPNIVVVYEVGEAPCAGREEPLHYIAMELVEGRSLKSLPQGGRLSLRRCLDLAAPLADGLARAHEVGIIHRDLKPSNIVVTRDGHPKILDFGIAKLSRWPDESVTATKPDTLTAPGAMLGTVGYMSPEQVGGVPVTAASDQFSFGCILYEMLTGRRAFARATGPETLVAIMREQPVPIEEIQPSIPAPLRWLVERCLAKEPGDRYASTRDLARDLLTLREHASDRGLGLVPLQGRSRPVKWGFLTAGTALGAVVSTALAWFSGSFHARVEPEFRPLTFRSGVVGHALFAPSGETILYTASWEGQSARTFQTLPDAAGFDRSLDAEEQFPLSYSSDGSQVLVLLGTFRASVSLRGTLAWWPALGGRARPVMEGAGWSDWAERGRFFTVARDAGGERVLEVRDAAGALQHTLFKTGGAITYVRIAPDERHVVFIHHPRIGDNSGAVWVVGSDGANPHALTPVFEQLLGLDWNRRTGEIWFSGAPGNAWGSTLWAVGLSGGPRTLYALSSMQVLASVAPSGDRCLMKEVQGSSNLIVRRRGQPLRELTWFGWSVVTDLSPDDRHILFFDAGATAKTQGTWLRPLEGGDAVRLTDGVPSRFSPDGRWIVTPVSAQGQPTQLALIPVGAGERRQLTSPPGAYESPSFAGPSTILSVRSQGGSSEVWRTQTDGSGARSLGASGCDLPAAAPSLSAFVCVGEAGRGLLVFPMEGRGAGRRVREIPAGDRIKYVRWNGTGDRIYAVTSRRRFLTVDAATGGLLAEETLPLPAAGPYDNLVGAAFSADAAIQAYSAQSLKSGLILMGNVK